MRLDQPAITRANSSGENPSTTAFSPDGRLFATATWEPLRRYGWEIDRLPAVAFAPNGLTCAAGSDTGQVVLFGVDA